MLKKICVGLGNFLVLVIKIAGLIILAVASLISLLLHQYAVFLFICLAVWFTYKMYKAGKLEDVEDNKNDLSALKREGIWRQNVINKSEKSLRVLDDKLNHCYDIIEKRIDDTNNKIQYNKNDIDDANNEIQNNKHDIGILRKRAGMYSDKLATIFITLEKQNQEIQKRPSTDWVCAMGDLCSIHPQELLSLIADKKKAVKKKKKVVKKKKKVVKKKIVKKKKGA